MTTIVYRDGILAADTRAYSGDKNPIGRKKKIHRLQDGSLLGISSAIVGLPEKFMNLVSNSLEDFPTLPIECACDAILIRPDGTVYFFSEGDTFTGPLIAPYVTLGSGEKFATGACDMGATAAEAVRVACRNDPWTQEPIETLRLP